MGAVLRQRRPPESRRRLLPGHSPEEDAQHERGLGQHGRFAGDALERVDHDQEGQQRDRHAAASVAGQLFEEQSERHHDEAGQERALVQDAANDRVLDAERKP